MDLRNRFVRILRLSRRILAPDILLDVRGLSAAYGAVRVLKNVSFSVRRSESTSILGVNGAGKSTLLKALSGITVKRCGEIALQSDRIDGLPPHRIVDLGISLVPEGRQLFPTLSVTENLEMGGLRLRRRNLHREAMTALGLVWELFPRLAERRSQTAGTLSGGEQQMLAIGRALASDPKLLLLDEPTVGLAPQVIEDLFLVFHKLKKNGLSIVLAEQNVRLALDLADTAVLLDLGHVVVAGSAAELSQNKLIKDTYLGHAG
jgi:branched-chain amino acid transport system ATP-binding protein